MGTAHILYIPGVLLVGLVVGWILGMRSAVDELKRKQLRMKE